MEETKVVIYEDGIPMLIVKAKGAITVNAIFEGDRGKYPYSPRITAPIGKFSLQEWREVPK